jgi:trans-aconitate methyltransferase
MSGFSSEWLALREPADAAARSRKVMDACADYFKERSPAHICDMGAGTGASVRAFSHLFSAPQWTLVDNDAGNLALAKELHPHVATKVCDFSQNPDCWPEDTTLVATTAFVDLTSRAWIDRFVEALSARRLPLLCTLTVDDKLSLSPSHSLDTAVFDAFRAHQHSDKGFGPALGGEAAAYLEAALQKAGYKIVADESPWHVARGELLRQLLDGTANAVRETGKVPNVDAWLHAVQASTTSFAVGHRDIFAVPA